MFDSNMSSFKASVQGPEMMFSDFLMEFDVMVVTFILRPPDSPTWERTIRHSCNWKPGEPVHSKGMVSFPRISDCGAGIQSPVVRSTDVLQNEIW